MNSLFNFDTQPLLQAFGLIFIALGVVIRLGMWKKWYWRGKGTAYSYIPIGVIFLLYSFNDPAGAQLGPAYWIYLAVYAIPIALGVWWVLRPPAFVKPDWVRWIEAYPEKTCQAMQKDALGDPEWERHVTSPKSVEAWAKSLERGKPASKAGNNTRK